MVKPSKKNIASLLRRLLVIFRFILFLPLSILITNAITDLFKNKYQELYPYLFRYKVFENLVPGIDIPNESKLLPFYIITGAINGILWIAVGTIIAPKKKFLVSCILLLFSIIFLLFIADDIKIEYLFSYLFSILAVVLLHPKRVAKILKSKFNQSIILGLVLISVLIFGLFLNNKSKNKLIWMTNKKMELEAEIKGDRVPLDMNGDGIYEMFINPAMTSNNDKYDSNSSLVLKDNAGNVLATTPRWFGDTPKSFSMDRVTPPLGSGLNEVAQVNMYVDNVYETASLFLRLEDNLLKPICKVEGTTSMSDCLFYSTDGFGVAIWGGLYGGLGDDNKLAVVELVDEYPKIRAGKTVVWGIYIYNGSFFEQQLGKNYDKYFDNIYNEKEWRSGRGYIGLIKKSDMDQNSIDYLNKKLYSTLSLRQCVVE